MKLSYTDRYELTAEAFRIMTGHMMPGKDVSAAANSPLSEDERFSLWRVWQTTNIKCVGAMLTAFERVMPDGPDGPEDEEAA